MVQVVLFGCAPHAPFVNEKDPARIAGIRRLVEGARQHHVKSTHRAILTIGKKQYVMTGRVEVQGEDIRIVAVNDFGMTLFEVEKKAQDIRVGKLQRGFRTRHMVRGVLRDVEVIYRLVPPPEATLKWGRKGGVFSVKAFAHPREVYAFDEETGAITDYYEFGLGRKLYEAHMRMPSSQDSRREVLPEKISIVNRRLGYTLDITVMDGETFDGDPNAGR